MLTEKQVEKICEAIKAKVSKESGIPRERVDEILDRKADFTRAEWKKVRPILDEIFKM